MERALELDPHYAPLLATMAHYHAPVRWWRTTDPRDLALALEFAERAVQTDPQLAEAHLWKGYAHWRRGEIDESLESFQRVKELDPNEFQSWYFTAAALTELGRWEEALESQRKALQLQPSVTYIVVNIAMLLMEIGDLDAAMWACEEEQRLERLPGAVTVVNGGIMHAEVLRRAKRLEAARERCMEAIQQLEQSDSMARGPARLNSLNHLGRIALDQRDTSAATVAFEQVVSGVRTQQKGVGMGLLLASSLAGLTRAGQGPEHYEEARRLFDRRVGYDFSLSNVHACNVLLDLAYAARTLGREGEAQELYTRARAAGTRQTLD